MCEETKKSERKTGKGSRPRKAKPAPFISNEVLDGLLAEHYKGPGDNEGANGLLAHLTKALMERVLESEMSYHLGYEKGENKSKKDRLAAEIEEEAQEFEPLELEQNNCRNGSSKKTLYGEKGSLEIQVPRDREGAFEPRFVPKYQRRLEGFDENIIAMYARGMTVREIQGFLLDQYKVKVSPELISKVTDDVLQEVRLWQTRSLESMYPVVFFDALRVKIRDEGGMVKNKAVYLALALKIDGTKEVLGLWIENQEGAKFWLKVINELRNRGLEDILIAVVDGLKGFPEAINTVYPETLVQSCIVHLTRFSLACTNWRDRKEVAAHIRSIYQAPSAEAAKEALEQFALSKWGQKYPTIAISWRRNWMEVIPFFAFSPEIRKMIYTTNAIESLHMQVRKVIKNRGHFPSDEAACKLIYLTLLNVSKRWQNAAPHLHWNQALNQFAIHFGERFTNFIGR